MRVFVGNTNLIELFGLESVVEQVFINDADVEVTIVDNLRVAVYGQTWPLTLGYVPGSDGDYMGIISEDVAFTSGATYYALVDAHAGTNRFGHWEVAFVPRVRNQ